MFASCWVGVLGGRGVCLWFFFYYFGVVCFFFFFSVIHTLIFEDVNIGVASM